MESSPPGRACALLIHRSHRLYGKCSRRIFGDCFRRLLRDRFDRLFRHRLHRFFGDGLHWLLSKRLHRLLCDRSHRFFRRRSHRLFRDRLCRFFGDRLHISFLVSCSGLVRFNVEGASACACAAALEMTRSDVVANVKQIGPRTEASMPGSQR